MEGASARGGEGSASQFLLPTTLNVDANFIKINFFYDVSSSFSFYLRRVRKKITAKHFCPLAAPPVPLPSYPSALHFPSLCHVLPVGFRPFRSRFPLTHFYLPTLPFSHISVTVVFMVVGGFTAAPLAHFRRMDGRRDQRGLGGSLPTASNLNTYSGEGDEDGERTLHTRQQQPVR